VFLDANVFIHAYGGTNGRKTDACTAFMRKLAKGEQRAATSTLVAEEVLHYFLERKGKEIALWVLRSMSGQQNLCMLMVDEKALKIIPEFIEAGLGSADALHAAVMKANGESVICSFDKGFDSAPGIKRKEP